MPTRQQFSPCAFGALLPFVSLIEFAQTSLPRVRVVGSELRGIFGTDPYSELLRNGLAGSLDTILEVKSTVTPLCGAVQSDGIGRAGQLRFWLRLPLGLGEIVDSVIGLDINISGARAPDWAIEQAANSFRK